MLKPLINNKNLLQITKEFVHSNYILLLTLSLMLAILTNVIQLGLNYYLGVTKIDVDFSQELNLASTTFTSLSTQLYYWMIILAVTIFLSTFIVIVLNFIFELLIDIDNENESFTQEQNSKKTLDLKKYSLNINIIDLLKTCGSTIFSKKTFIIAFKSYVAIILNTFIILIVFFLFSFLLKLFLPDIVFYSLFFLIFFNLIFLIILYIPQITIAAFVTNSKNLIINVLKLPYILISRESREVFNYYTLSMIIFINYIWLVFIFHPYIAAIFLCIMQILFYLMSLIMVINHKDKAVHRDIKL